MKAGIITHYNVHNHGAQLQLYALSKTLRKMGYDAKALQFNKNYDFMDLDASKKYDISFKSIPTYIRYLFKNGLRRTLYNIKKRKLLNRFRNENDLNGEFYSKAEGLDLVVIGSDEIFSIEPGLNPCFYGMGVPCCHIVSYAASFGPTTIKTINDLNAVNFVRAGLNQIDEILVRDRNSKNIVEELTSKKAEIVCDPVLLIDFLGEYKKNNKEDRKPLKQKYCIVYSYDYNMNDDETVRVIKEYAMSNNLKIISIGYYHRWCDKNVQVKPLDVFKWFANAEIVFTDTFHGTVISIATHSQFWTKIRGNSNKLEFLLDQYNLKSRITNDFKDISSKKAIDYSNVPIDIIRNNSLHFLESAIKKATKISDE